MVIGNKLDLVESDDSRLVKPEDGEKLAKVSAAFSYQRNCTFRSVAHGFLCE